MNELKITLNESDILSPINLTYPQERLIIDKSSLGGNENEKINYNLIAVARKNLYVKNLVIDLANKGFYLTKHENGISTFEKFTGAENFKKHIKRENLQFFRDLFYTIETPKVKIKSSRMIIVFSSVADFPYNANIARRNCFINFSSISKYIPSNTYVLRISDIGSIVGSFYMNNNFNDKVEINIQDLIRFVLNKYDISQENLVLYGVSKGATAALYHGILGNYKSIAVDPIVTDEHHEKKYNDSHFTIGTFPETKQKKFVNLLKNKNIPDNINILYSKNSPIYSYINTIIKENDLKKKINYINVYHPNIKDHPDVGPHTINILMLIINNLFYTLGELNSKDIDY